MSAKSLGTMILAVIGIIAALILAALVFENPGSCDCQPGRQSSQTNQLEESR